MCLEGSVVGDPAAAVGAGGHVDEAVVVACDELAVVVGRPVDCVAFALVGADGRDGLILLRRNGSAWCVEGSEVRRHIVDVDICRFGHGSREDRRAGFLLDLTAANAVRGRGERNRARFKNGVCVFVVVIVVFRLRIVAFVHLAETRELHHHELVLGGALVVGLRAGDGVHGGGVGFAVVAEGVFDEVEGEAGPGGGEVVKHFVGGGVGGEDLARFEFVAADDEGSLVDFHFGYTTLAEELIE